MATSITDQPTATNMNFANQKLVYSYSSNTAAWDDTYRFVVAVEEGTGTGTEIARVYIPENPSGRAHFDLGQIVYNRVAADDVPYGLTTPIHSYGANWMSRNTNNVEKYTVKVFEFNGSSVGSVEQTSTIYVCGGSRSIVDGDEYQASMASFYGTDSAAKFWLTDRVPVNDTITVNVDEYDHYVAAFINRSVVSSVTKFTFTIYAANGTSLFTTDVDVNGTNGGASPSGTATQGMVNYLFCGPDNLETNGSYMSTYSTWSYYTFVPKDSGGTQRGNTLKFVKKCSAPKNTPVQLAFSNTKAGWEYLHFDGKRNKTVSRQSKMYRKTIGSYGATLYDYESTDRQSQAYHVEAQESYTLRSYMTSEQFDLLQYAMRSKNIWMKYGGRDGVWKPVTLDTQSLQIQSTGVAQMFEAVLNVKLAQYAQC